MGSTLDAWGGGELLGSKLVAPEIAEDVVRRPELSAEIYQQVSSKRLVLFSAPAGAGKSTAVLGLKESHPELKIAWLSLDEGDEDVAAFARLVAAAIRQVVPQFGEQTEQVLASRGQYGPAPIQLASVLVSDLAAEVRGPLVIVLDDLHRVDAKAVYELLDYFIERMPENIHIVITSRHDPMLRLAQLRGKDQMAEFRLDRLRLSVAEIAQMVNAAAGYGLVAADIELVNERTDGWPAGVKLVALSLRQLKTDDQRSSLLQKLGASQRLLFDYLVEEVLNRADAERRDFLLQTSILAELTPSLCSAVTQRKESAAVLNNLYRQNYFLSAIESSDGDAEGYRYHPLFAQFLQKQLKQREDLDLAELHLRAAGAVTNREQRIEHWLRAGAWEQAVAGIVEIGKEECDRSFISQKTMNWIMRVPGEVRAKHYWLDILEATLARQRGLLQKCVDLSTRALPAARAAGDILGEIETVWNLAFFRNGSEWDRELERLMENGEFISPFRQTYYLIGHAWSAMDVNDWDTIQKNLEEFIAVARREQY
jgi:ATP/maltotriose-dependent transcriptional regulator MalT